MYHLEKTLDDGQNSWWKYVVIYFSQYFVAFSIGVVPSLIIVVMNGGLNYTEQELDSMNLAQFGIGSNLNLVLLLIPSIVGLLTLTILLKPIHKRKLIDVINGATGIRWGKFWFAMGLMSVLYGTYLSLDYLIYPKNYILNFNLESLVPLVFISFLLIPIQSTSEEVIFRGYLMQGVASWTNNRWAPLIITSILFGLTHLFNSEISEYGFIYMMPQYLMFGLVFGLITILDDGIESAVGVHSAYNIFGSIFITFEGSSLPTSALLQKIQFNSPLVWIAIWAGVIFIMGKKYNWNYSLLKGKILETSSIKIPETTDEN